MYIKIFAKSETSRGVEISNLGKNGDDLLIKLITVYKTQPNTLQNSADYNKAEIDAFEPKIVINLRIYNAENYLTGEAKTGRIIGIPNKITSKETYIGPVNEVIALRYLKGRLEKLGLIENRDFKLLAQETWEDKELGMTKRVTIPDDTVIDNTDYASLILKVKSLLSLNYAVLNKENNMNIMYFFRILEDDLKLIEEDPNVLIEEK